jgi:mRNA deadenylase 3'-5' endonuclease subunit Ccr4
MVFPTPTRQFLNYTMLIFLGSNLRNFIDQNKTRLETSKSEYTSIYKQREQAPLKTNVTISTLEVGNNTVHKSNVQANITGNKSVVTHYTKKYNHKHI